MSKYLNLLWVAPATPLLSTLALLLVMATLPGRYYRLAYTLGDVYEVMFLVTPLVGVVALLAALGLRAASPDRLGGLALRRAILFACLAIVAPVGFLLMQMILSGFSR